MIAETIKILQEKPYYNVSEAIEIAKGKNEKIYTIKDMLIKIKRLWRLKKP